MHNGNFRHCLIECLKLLPLLIDFISSLNFYCWFCTQIFSKQKSQFFLKQITIIFIYYWMKSTNCTTLSSEKKQKRIKVKQVIVIIVSIILLNIVFSFLTHIRYCGCRGQDSELFSIIPVYYNKHYIKLRLLSV